MGSDPIGKSTSKNLLTFLSNRELGVTRARRMSPHRRSFASVRYDSLAANAMLQKFDIGRLQAAYASETCDRERSLGKIASATTRLPKHFLEKIETHARECTSKYITDLSGIVGFATKDAYFCKLASLEVKKRALAYPSP